jgi:predicted nucleic acid-binding protein
LALVLDASYTIALALGDEGLAGAAETLGRIAVEGAFVPPPWRFEVANGLLTAVCRKRIPGHRPTAILADLECLAITVDEASASRAWNATFALAERHGLTAYDATYLELASRLGATPVSLDHDLIGAARRAEVAVIEV